MIDPDYQSSEGHIKVVFTSDHILNRGVGFTAEFSVGMSVFFLVMHFSIYFFCC